MDGLTEGARDLVLAIFRMAVADYLALAYGHDGPGRPRRVRPRHRADAQLFLQGPWATCLGEWINLPARSIWAQARAARSDQARLRATNYVRVA